MARRPIPSIFGCTEWNNQIPRSQLDIGVICAPSLVEELACELQIRCWRKQFPKKWSVHRIVTAISLNPESQLLWKQLVQEYNLERSFERERTNFLEYRRQYPKKSEQGKLLKEFAKLNTSNRLLLGIITHLESSYSFSVVNLVCRRWHFVARCVWKRTNVLHIDSTNKLCCCAAPLIRPSRFTYRLPMLTTVNLSGGVCIDVKCLPYIFNFSGFSPPVRTLHCHDVTFCGCSISVSDANEKVCNFLRSIASLKELVLANVNVSYSYIPKGRQETRSLDFGPFQFASRKFKSAVGWERLQFSGLLLQRFTTSFDKFCRELHKCNTTAIILSGATASDYAAGLPETRFALGFANLVPFLREIALCSMSFSDSMCLSTASLDLLSKSIRRDSSLELFCLTNAEISEEAVRNLQRCAKLQIIILLRCKITKADPDLRSLVTWHPRADLPSSLVTDDVTIPRWFKPVYFRVVYVDTLADLGGAKFALIGKRWWTIRALAKSAQLGLADFVLKSLYIAPEEIVGETCWLQDFDTEHLDRALLATHRTSKALRDPLNSSSKCHQVGIRSVLELIYWRDVKKSAVVFASTFLLLLAFANYSAVSVFAYVGLALLAATFSFRVFKYAKNAIQKSDEGNPFKQYLDKDLKDKLHQQVDIFVGHFHDLLRQLRRLFLVEDIFDSLKFGVLLWALTYVGAWFSGICLAILAVVAIFTIPKFYEVYKEPIDRYYGIAYGHVKHITDQV